MSSKERREIQKKRKREERKKKKIEARKNALETNRKLQNHQKKTEEKDRKAEMPSVQENKIEVPPRNSPCPIHPEHKIKNCPHGCLEMFKRNKARQIGVTVVKEVEKGDPRAGKMAVERDASAGAMNDLAQVLGNM